MNSLSYNEVKYVKLSPEEMKSRGILGRLKGIIADFRNPTRNGRLYTEELWDKTFKDPLVQEKVENNLMLGELGHPEQRTEIDMEKVAICLDGMPYKDAKAGKVIGTFNILDTPNGRILKTLCDYGVKIGVSSRGAGDIMESYDGTETVEPGTYSLECWDAVLVPAVKEARPQYMTESLNNDKDFKQQIRDILKGATPNEKKVMIESLNNLKIDYKMRRATNNNNKNGESQLNIVNESKSEVTTNTSSAAIDNGAYLVEELQRQIRENKELKEQLQTVQEQLSVCYTKEAKYEEKITSISNKINVNESLNSEINNLKSQIKSLTEQLEQKDTQLGAQKSKYLELLESKKAQIKQSRALNESIATKDDKIKMLIENLNNEKMKSENAKNALNESLEELKKNSAIKIKEINSKLSKQSSLTEHYKKIARQAVSKYINSKAEMLGIDASQIKGRLTEGYTFEDIDRICEGLQSYNANMRKLPIDLMNNDNDNNGFKFNARITESKEPIKNALPNAGMGRYDDDVDDSLLRLAGLKN